MDAEGNGREAGALNRHTETQSESESESEAAMLVVSTLKVFLFDVTRAAALVRIMCFFLLGGVLYFGGRLLRRK